MWIAFFDCAAKGIVSCIHVVSAFRARVIHTDFLVFCSI